jgi:bleomycin hydrolase
MDEPVRITADDLASASAEFNAERANIVAKNAVTSAGLRKAARVPEGVAANALTFDVEVTQGERCDQKRSGRCWMFASLNTMRYRTIKKYNLRTFELSQAYPLFWDKLEKSNWFLQNILDTLDEPLSGRLVSYLLMDPIGDGGQWDMFRSLVKKYGVVPKEAMPETECSSNTREMDSCLTRYLRGCAKRLRQSHEAGVGMDDLLAMKKQMMGDVYHLLATCLGEPPARFSVRLRDKEGKLALAGTFTPQEFFAEAVGMELDDYVSLISAPTADKPFGHVYTVSRLGNVVEDGGVRYLNLPPQELKRMAVAQLKDDLPVWFGCDVAQSYLRDEGIMDTAALDVDTLLGFPVEGCMTKAERLDYHESLMTHAMVLEGVNLDADGSPTLWKVENSWGKEHGRNGFDTLSDAWFDEYVYQIVVDKKYLTDEERHAYETEKATVLEPWDPMGSLARCYADAPAEGAAADPAAISPAWAAEQAQAFPKERANRVARNSVTYSNVLAAARDASRMRTYTDTYGVATPKTGDVTNQRQSGRCWMFASLNVARQATMKLLDVDSFEFSQAYGMFYDKLEKANAMLEYVIQTADLPEDSRELECIFDLGRSDGGYYNFAMNLILKYGLVPKSAMPESAASKNSREMNAQLSRLLHKDASILRHAHADGETDEQLRTRKAAMMADVHRLLCTCLGEPPVTFDFECKVGKDAQVDAAKLSPVEPAKDAKAADAAADATEGDKPADKPTQILRDRGITPQQFRERYVPFDAADFVDLLSIPNRRYPFGHVYHITLLDYAGAPVPNRYLNTDQAVLEQAAIASLKAGVPVAFACDVLQEFPRHISDFNYVLGTDTMDFDGLFGIDFGMSRQDMAEIGETRLTHEMTLQGVELDASGNPLAWRVENSWGKEAGKDGYLIMTADWFRTYGGNVSVRREFVPADALRLWDTLPAEDVPQWSGLGRFLGARD